MGRCENEQCGASNHAIHFQRRFHPVRDTTGPHFPVNLPTASNQQAGNRYAKSAAQAL
jgi:hypothetical protein